MQEAEENPRNFCLDEILMLAQLLHPPLKQSLYLQERDSCPSPLPLALKGCYICS